MSHDPALEWLLRDAKEQGLSLAEYERKYGIVLPSGRFDNPAQARIKRNEVPAGLIDEDELSLAEHKEKRRSVDRRHTELLIESSRDDDEVDPS